MNIYIQNTHTTHTMTKRHEELYKHNVYIDELEVSHLKEEKKS